MASAAAATWSRPRANKSRVLLNDAAAARASSFCVFCGVFDEALWKSASRSSCSRTCAAWPATPQPRNARASASLSADNRTRARRRGATPSCLRRGSGASAAARSAISNWAARLRRAAAAAPAAPRARRAKDASLAVSFASCSRVSTCFASVRARALSGRPFFFCAVFTALLQRLCYGACIALNPSGVYKCGFYNCDRHHRAVLLHVCATAA